MSHSLAGRRLAARRALRHRLVAILYSHVRSDARSSANPPRPCQAASIVSWTASSASPTARTGRLADAQFPSAAVYALPPERSAHQIAPRQPETTLERDDPDASPPDQPAHRRTPGRPEGERPARPAQPCRAHAGGPEPPGAAQVVTSHHSDASGRPRPDRGAHLRSY